MKRRISILLVIMMVLSLFAGCASKPAEEATAAPEAEVVKIGWIGSLTGDQAVWGTCEFNTVKQLVEEANENGGWLGKQIEVVGYDTKGDALEAVNATKRLVGQDNVVAIIGPNASGQAIAMSSVLEEAQVPGIATVATNPKVTVGDDGNVKPYNFRVCFIDPYQGAVAAGFAAEELNFKKAAILYDVADEYSQGLTQFFEETFLAKGGEIVAKEAFKFGDVDFRPQLSKIKEAQPEVIFMPYFFKEVALSSSQARELGIDAVLIGGDGWTSEQLLEMAGEAVQGSYVVNHLDFEDPDVQDFKNSYMDKYGSAVELNGYLAYDAFRLLEQSVNDAGVVDAVKIKEAMENASVQGITGKITINPETHNPEGKEAAMLLIDDNKYVFQMKYSVDTK